VVLSCDSEETYIEENAVLIVDNVKAISIGLESSGALMEFPLCKINRGAGA